MEVRVIRKTDNELCHHGILGMKWGIRRYQNKDGSLTTLGRQHLSERQIRTADNLGEKTIAKGTKMYRVTSDIKDGTPGKSKYVTYLDTDRALYKEGSLIKSYVGRDPKDAVYEHEFELKTDIHIPSLKTVREVEKRILSNEKHKQEVAESYVKSFMMTDGYTSMKDIEIMSDIAKKIGTNSPEQNRQLYKTVCNKYGDYKGDDYFFGAKSISTAKNDIDTYDSLTIERSLGMAKNTKASIIKELQKQGYNAMYDNAGIGVQSDGSYNKKQEGVEPLIIFDSKSTLLETNTRKIDSSQQRESAKKYEDWKTNRDETLRKFK